MENLPVRKNIRLEGYDYSQNGCYFVTICVKDRCKLLGKIAPVGAHIVRPLLSNMGKTVEQAVNNIPIYHDSVKIDKYVIMPNHIHMILAIDRGNGRTLFAPTVSQIVKQCKEYITKQIGCSIWQKSFHDRIIRDDEEYENAWQYIDENPARWEEDEYYISSPRFIVFEGLDGSGKTTQIRLVADRLLAAGRSVEITAEPTSSPLGGLIRSALSGLYACSAEELAALFTADRAAHNREIEGLLAGGATVLCDRYYYSTFAYQGMDADLNWLMDMNLNCPAIRKPDLCIFLDLDPATCFSRVTQRQEGMEIYEYRPALENARKQFYNVFELLKDRENIRIVDASKPIDEVSDKIFQIIMELK